MALFDALDPVNVFLIYANANFPANLSKWPLSAVVLAVNADRLLFICRSSLDVDQHDPVKLISPESFRQLDGPCCLTTAKFC